MAMQLLAHPLVSRIGLLVTVSLISYFWPEEEEPKKPALKKKTVKKGEKSVEKEEKTKQSDPGPVESLEKSKGRVKKKAEPTETPVASPPEPPKEEPPEPPKEEPPKPPEPAPE